MNTDLKTLFPRPDLYAMFSRMQSMCVVSDGVKHDGEADISLDPDTRALTITVKGAAPKAKAKK